MADSSAISFKSWFWVCAAAGLFCLFAIAFLDRPVAEFVQFYPHGHLRHVLNFVRDLLTAGLKAMFALLLLGLLGMVQAARAMAGGGRLTRAKAALATAGASAIGGLAVNEFLLKPLFGRCVLGDYFTPAHCYGFFFLHGSPQSSFPSGHTVLVVSFFAVLIAFYPRQRPLWLAVIALTLVCLVIAEWHFVSDLAGGVMVGSSAALIATRLAGRARLGRRAMAAAALSD